MHREEAYADKRNLAAGQREITTCGSRGSGGGGGGGKPKPGAGRTVCGVCGAMRAMGCGTKNDRRHLTGPASGRWF